MTSGPPVLVPTLLERRVRDVFRAVFAERDLARAGDFWTPDAVHDVLPLGASLRGRPAILRFFAELFDAVPDWTLALEGLVGAHGQAAVRWRGTGTHDGAPWRGVPPAGRRIDLRGCDVVRFALDGRVGHSCVYFDGAALARQLGVLRLPAS